MSLDDPSTWAGRATLLFCLIGYLVANRIPALRRFRRIILVSGILLFAVGVYVDRDNFVAGFKAGWDYVRPYKRP